jgi:hypothetical protein
MFLKKYWGSKIFPCLLIAAYCGILHSIVLYCEDTMSIEYRLANEAPTDFNVTLKISKGAFFNENL